MGELVLVALGMCGPLLYGQHRPLNFDAGTIRNGQVSRQSSLRSKLRIMVSLVTSFVVSQPIRQYGRPLGLWKPET